MTNPVHTEIIARIEKVRESLHHNRSEFCRAFGMKPQTYNNFIGAQGSKPNIDLILGAVVVWRADPIWLLTGQDYTGLPSVEPVWLDKREGPAFNFPNIESWRFKTASQVLPVPKFSPLVLSSRGTGSFNAPPPLEPIATVVESQALERIATALENISELMMRKHT